MKKTITGAISAALVVTAIPATQFAHAEEQTSETTQLIVKYKDGESLTKSDVRSVDASIDSSNDDSALLDVSVEDTDQVIEKLEAMDEVDYVEENTTYKLSGDEDLSSKSELVATKEKDELYDSQLNLKNIKAPGAWEELKDNTDAVTVAVLDTGVQASHVDLEGRVKDGVTFLPAKEGEDEKEVAGAPDSNGHGTFISGIIAANTNNGKGIAGVAGETNMKILPVKVMNNSGVGDAFHITEGIKYATEQKVDVINLSVSGEYNQSMEEAIEEAKKAGIVVVAAAGNGGGNADASFPAALDSVISVGSVTDKDQAYSLSNKGKTVDLVAPGVAVASTALSGDLGTEGNGKYKLGTGTSYATPHVAAVAALYKLKHPTATATEIESALIKTADDLGTEGRDDATGYGRVNAEAALADDIDLDKSVFTAPKKNADVTGTIPLQVSLVTTDTTSVAFYVDGELVDKVTPVSNSAKLQLDTTKYNDGVHEITAISFNGTDKQTEIKTSVTVRNKVASGYMFNVLAPNKAIAKGASVQLFEKVDGAYKELWSGLTDSNGSLRVPSNLGTDTKNIKVVVQGMFEANDTDKVESAFLYSRDLTGSGNIELQSDNTVPVKLSTIDEDSKQIEAKYYMSLKDSNDVVINKMKLVNSTEGSKESTVYVDKGAYNMYASTTVGDKQYFLTNDQAKIASSTTKVEFNTADAGEVTVDNADKQYKNTILYIYNDKMLEATGQELTAGHRFYVSPGQYHYFIDLEVDGGTEKEADNWVYIMEDYKKQANVEKGGKTVIKAGGSITATDFKADQAAVERYSVQRGLDYVQRENPNEMYKVDKFFYTTQAFSDEYGNHLRGMLRGSVSATEAAFYTKDVSTGETVSTMSDDESTIQTKDFGNINPKFEVKNADGVVTGSLSNNKLTYTNGLFDISSEKYAPGTYTATVSLEKSPLIKTGTSADLQLEMKDSSTEFTLTDQAGVKQNAYIWINKAVKDEDGDIEWKTTLNINLNTTTKSISIPNSQSLSEEKGGNMAIIRYVKDGKYGYIYRSFDKVEDLANMEIPEKMQKVEISAEENGEKIANIGTKLWMLKKAVNVGGVTSYVTANNLQNYPADSVYLEPDDYVIEGNYVTTATNDKKDNFYFVQPYKVEDYTTTVGKENKVVFEKNKLVEINVEALTNGYSDNRGILLYPYNKYSSSFVNTLRVGHRFYVPTDLDMNIQLQYGFGDTEDHDKIWNYFMTKGQQKFTTNTPVTWKVGGNLSTKVTLPTATFTPGAEIKGTATIADGSGNTVSSVLVNTTNDYSVAEDGLDESPTTYTLGKDGLITAKAADEVEDGDYTISHNVATVVTGSFLPTATLTDAKGNVVAMNSSSAYYGHINSLFAPTTAGDYNLKLQIAGSPLGVASSDTAIKVKANDVVTPPAVVITKPTTTTAISDKSTSLKGKTTPGAKVVLRVGKTIIATAIADGNGDYKFSFNPLVAGKTITITASMDGSEDQVSTFVVADKTAPTVTSVSATNNSKKIVVKTEKGAKIKLVINGKTYTKTATSAGTYTFTIPTPKAGTTWKVTVTDLAGNATTKTGKVLDKVAPKVTSVVAANNSKKIVVKTEKGAKIKLVINGKTYTKTANSAGSYTFTIAKAKAGTTWKVSVSDTAGNVTTKTGKVKDKIAPTIAKVTTKITTKTTAIKGNAEKKATVLVYKNGKLYKKVKVTSKGTFNFTIGKQKKNTAFTFIVKDAAGNKSSKKKVVVK